MILADNIFMRVNDTLGVTLTSGVNYPAGSVVTLQTDGEYTNGRVLNPGATTAGTEVDFGGQIVGILTEDVDATSAAKPAVIATECEANLNNITFASGQAFADIAGTLQSKNIKLKGWNK